MSPYDGAGERDGRQRIRRRRRRTGGDRTGARSRRGDMPSADPNRDFILYVEGARDWDLLRVWAHRLSPVLARSLEPRTVILGGRRPARALEHFRERGGAEAGSRALIVLDRDHHDELDGPDVVEPGLEVFMWRRRHIESYLLVPDAIRRALDRTVESSRIDRLIDDHIPGPDDEAAHQAVNAKHLLGSKGPLAKQLGRELPPGEIARRMRAEELHADVISLYERIRVGLGLTEPELQVIRRPLPI